MPFRPNRPCPTPGCPALIGAGVSRCPRHQRQEDQRYNAQRPARHGFYQSQEWRNFRAQIIKERGAVCEHCGIRGVTMDVDHRISIKERWDLRLDPANVQVLAHRCHSAKTARQGRWNPT